LYSSVPGINTPFGSMIARALESVWYLTFMGFAISDFPVAGNHVRIVGSESTIYLEP
jgi:hypothetical protein